MEAANYQLRLTGPEFAEATLGEMVLRDLAVLVPLMLVVVSILLHSADCGRIGAHRL